MEWNLALERSSGIALYLQIADEILARIKSGVLSAGVKLPSTRDSAKHLGVHRRTVVQAYEMLEAQGWVSSQVGQGTFVTVQAREHPAEPIAVESAPAAFSWEGALRRRADPLPEFWRYLAEGQAAPGMIRFTGATADPSFFPAEDFRAILDEVFATHGGGVLEYGPTEGLLSLRELVAERLETRGVRVSPEQVMIVSGSQQGLDLISRLLAGEGDTALVEEPGYTNGFRLFQTQGVRVAGVPIDGDGIRCDLLDEISARTGPRLLYLMPIFQNPTGLSLAPGRVDPLLEICARRHLPLVEDQFDAELFYEGEAPQPVKARDHDDLVVLLGSFSKILFPGLRLGWMVVPRPLTTALRDLKQMADFSSSLVAQYAMELYCRRGLLDRHLLRVRELYGARLRVMLAALTAEFPAGARWTRPRGGLTLWVTLPRGVRALELLPQARREGVDFSPGSFFFPNGGGAEHLRLSYIRETEERIQQGIGVLGNLLRNTPVAGAREPAAGPFI